MSVLIRGVRPYGEGERVDVLVDDGQIAQIGPDLAIPDTADVIDATGHVLLPGFVDLHTGHRKQRRHPGHGVGGRADRHRAFGLGPGGPLHHRLGIEPVGNRPGRGGDPRITHPVQCGHVGAQLGVECAAILDVQAGRLPHDQRGPPLR